MTRRILLIADDYGLSPGIGDAVIALIEAGRLSGTGCMTIFPEWEAEAARLRQLTERAGVGLHLTLTDQMALSGVSSLAPQGRLPALKTLVLSLVTGRIEQRDIEAELDMQLARFVVGLGRPPDFLDGHQHVHFLPVVRTWLVARHGAGSLGEKPMLRGAPALGAVSPKVASVALMAAGFDQAMRKAGFRVVGPLGGFYDWAKPARFADALQRAVATLPDGALFMCHPGQIDHILRARDVMQAARPVELEVLMSDRFGRWLDEADVAIGRFPA